VSWERGSFFQSAEQGDLLFCGGLRGKRRTNNNNMEESIRTRKGKLVGRGGTTHDWFVRCDSKKGAEDIGSFNGLKGKEIWWWIKTGRRKKHKEQEQKKCISRSERTIQVMVERGQYQNGSEWCSRCMLGSQRSHCHDKKNQVLLTAARTLCGKDKCRVRLRGIKREYEMDT